MFACTTDEYTFVPHYTPDDFVELARETLGTDVIRLSLCSSNLIGIFLLANANGAVVPAIAYKDERAALGEYLDVSVIHDFTAIANLASCNDKGCAVSPLLSKKAVGTISEALGVKAEPTTIAGLDVTGSCLAATNKGFLSNPNATDKDLTHLKGVLGVDGSTGTLNYGNPFVKGGMIANSRGAIIGSTTTPFELSRVDDALFLDR